MDRPEETPPNPWLGRLLLASGSLRPGEGINGEVEASSDSLPSWETRKYVLKSNWKIYQIIFFSPSVKKKLLDFFLQFVQSNKFSKKPWDKAIPCPGRGHDPVRGLWRGLWVGTPWAYSFHYCSLTCPSPVCPVQFSSPTKRLEKRQVQNQCSRPRSYDSLHVCLLLWVNFKSNYILMAWSRFILLLFRASSAGSFCSSQKKTNCYAKQLFILQVLLMMEATYLFRINRF